MAIVNVRDLRIIETDSSFRTANFTVFLDQVTTVPVNVLYYLQDGSAASASGVRDFQRAASLVTIAAGTDSVRVGVPIYGDTEVEGNETFELVVFAGENATLAGGAAALSATATIYDNDDGMTDPSEGDGGLAERIFGPASASATLPTLSARSLSISEGDSSWNYAYLLVTLDRVATAPVSVEYYLQDGSAAAAQDDFTGGSGRITINPGQQSTYVRIPIDGDTTREGDESFRVVFLNPTNAVLDGNAPALIATTTIRDDDGPGAVQPAGLGGLAARLSDPASASSSLPTFDVRDVTVVEGDGGFQYGYFLVTLDKVASAPVTARYYFQDRSASAALGDYGQMEGTITIAAGEQSAYVRARINGDDLIEGTERFDMVVTNVTNAVFAGNAEALTATATILDDDGGETSFSAGVGGFSEQIRGPRAEPGSPTVSVRDVRVVEGGQAYFLITLDGPSSTDLTFDYMVVDGTASAARGDYSQAAGRATIAAGEESTWLRFRTNDDVLIEGDETFSLLMTNLSGGAFENAAAGLLARATILDDDGGPISAAAGTGGAARQVAAPSSGGGPAFEAADVTVFEGASSVSAYMPIFLSQPATARTTVRYETLSSSAGTSDFNGASGTFTFERGQDSGYLRFIVRGDTLIEGDETFQVRFTDVTNAEFVDGGTSTTATVRILDDDDSGGGTAGGVGVDFVDPRTTSGRDVLYGTPGYDVIDGRGGDDYIYGDGGNDRLYGGAGADTLNGGGGDDRMFGGLGNDRYVVHGAGDLVLGETGFSLGGGIDTILTYVTYTLPSNVEILRLQGEFNIWGYGNFAPNALVGNTGDNTLDGGGGDDAITAKDGDDVLRGGLGQDLLMGNGGADVFDFNSVAESPAGRAGRDFINGFTHGLDKIDLSTIDANPYAAGNQAFRFIGDDDFSARGRASAGELHYKHYDGDFVIVGADVTGSGQADMQILVNLTTYMTGTDFIL